MKIKKASFGTTPTAVVVYGKEPLKGHDNFAMDRSTGTRIESSLWSSVDQLGGGLERPNLAPRA